MKRLIAAALAGAALITAPMAAQAQPHGGWHGGGGWRGGSGGWHGGSSFDGWRGGGWRGGYGGNRFYGAAFLGLGLGLYAAPWFWDYPGYYGYYGYPGYYDYDYDDDYDYGPPAPPPPGSEAAPSPGVANPGAPPSAACGSWHWDPAAQRYQWMTTGC